MPNFRAVPLQGPNRWAPFSVLELTYPKCDAAKILAVGPKIARELEQFIQQGQFTATHPNTIESAKHCAGKVALSTSHSELVLAIARWFSALSGVPTRSTNIELDGLLQLSKDDAELTLAMEMEEPALSLRCFEIAFDYLGAAEQDKPFSVVDKFRELFDYADDVRLGPSSRAILRAAIERNIPFSRLNQGSLVQLGEGAYQRRTWTAETDATSAVAEAIASDKDLTKRLLRQVGVPVPRGRVVSSAEDAWTAALEIGFPVVVKPVNANHQRGISIELYERDEILQAYDWAVTDGETNDIIVEQFASGYHHRLLVVGDKLVAAARGHMETVVGDGTSTIQQLVDELNRDPKRGEAYNDPLSIVKIDTAILIELKKQSMDAESIPTHGQVVLVSRNGDLTTDCTREINPKLAQQAVLAARMIGLDIAGLDILATDISQPLETQNGAVVEVNAGPSLSSHVAPLYGEPQPVGQAIIEMLFPGDAPSRVEIGGIARSSSSEKILEQLMHQQRTKGVSGCGLLNHRQIFLDAEPIAIGETKTSTLATALLCNPCLKSMLLHADVQDSAKHGVGVPRLDFLIVPNDLPVTQENNEWTQGLRALLHAVPAGGSVYCDQLSAEAFARIQSQVNEGAKCINTLEPFDLQVVTARQLVAG